MDRTVAVTAKAYFAQDASALYFVKENLLNARERQIKRLRKVEAHIKWNDRIACEIVFAVEGLRRD